MKAANEAVDQRKKALEIIGATEGQLAQVEAMRAEAVSYTHLDVYKRQAQERDSGSHWW